MPSELIISRRTMLRVLCSMFAGAGSAWGRNNGIRFGVLPVGGALDSRRIWEPLLAELSKAIEMPVSLMSMTSYDGLEQAIRRGVVDMSFLSGKMALDAVTQQNMRVVAQVFRHDGLPGYRALLIARKGPQTVTLKEVLAEPERWRLARGEKSSLSGYIVPQLQLFLPRGISMETRFQSETVGTHQVIALAVANGEADIATINTADFERFALQFPNEAAQLQVIWESDIIPHAQIVLRDNFPDDLVALVQNFLATYGRGTGAVAEAQRATLKNLHNFAGFRVADNSSLIPAAKIEFQLARQTAMQAQWVNEDARRARLERLERLYQQQLDMLRRGAPRSGGR